MKEAKTSKAKKANVETTIEPATEPTVIPATEPSVELGPVALVGGEYSPETSKDFSLDITYTEGTVADFAAQSENQLAALENLKTAVKGMANGRLAIIAAVKAALATGCPVAIVRHTFVECWIANGGTKTYANEIMLGCGIRLRAVRKDAGKSKSPAAPQAPANPAAPQAPAVPGTPAAPQAPAEAPAASGNAASVETPTLVQAPVVSLETTKGLTAEAIGKSIATAIIAEHGRDKAKEIMRYLMAAVHAADAA
jgi:hypothetical protein